MKFIECKNCSEEQNYECMNKANSECNGNWGGKWGDGGCLTNNKKLIDKQIKEINDETMASSTNTTSTR
jgi:hypothetical protein